MKTISQSQFEAGILCNIERINRYESGSDGSNGGCDCIGLDIGAIRLSGGSWPWTHGTNYTVRNRMKNFRSISSARELKKYELVFKAKKPGENGYSLPDRYKSSGDLNDYYHVGTVLSVNPLIIVHCTSVAGGIKEDTTLGAWKYAGWLDVIQEEKQEDKGEQGSMKTYQVVGGNLKLRKNPSTNAAVIKMIPNGSTVYGIEGENNGWMRVDYDGMEGYCMARYLQEQDGPSFDDDSIGAAIETSIATIEQEWEHLKMLISAL